MKKIEFNGDSFECNVDPVHLPFIERMIKGSTNCDESIQSMIIPSRPLWLRLAVLSLRWYRHRISPRLGSRCVFEPSCSHYAELAFREKGLFKGIVLTTKRLHRCRPANGGVDMP
jgi:putative membrane protein insertion efficiency factor